MSFEVTVIVAAFNAEATLRETLDSIRAQTSKPQQVIVVDDGSTDQTAHIAASYEGVEVIRQANMGVASAFNTAVSAARCGHVAFLDADDLWTAQCLETHHNAFLSRPDLVMSIGLVEEFVCPSLDAEDAARFAPRAIQPGWICGATVVVSDLFNRVGLFDPALRLGAWIDWVGRAKLRNIKVEVAPCLVLRRRLRPGTLSGDATAVRHASMQVARLALNRRRGITP
jgi:glycosyltransferase involved in cell wall biosynthesis